MCFPAYTSEVRRENELVRQGLKDFERLRKEQKKGKGGKKEGQRESRAETSEGLAEKARLLLPSVAFSLSSCLSRGFR